MFYHIKELQFNARVSKPDPAFATLLLEQFGGANGELAAALRYFGQAFGAKKPYPDKYDMLMDIATEEFSHLEIVGATIQMLLTGINGDLKNAADQSEIMQLLNGKAAKENMIHQGMVAPQFFVGSGGGPAYTNSQGVPWTAGYINGDVQGDLTSELRSDIGAESRAKLVYEYLLQFTDDPYVQETLRFLMTREAAHYQMFEAALASIQPNFPPGILQTDPRYSNLYFNMSSGNDFRGPWNQGPSSQFGEDFQFIDDPIEHVMQTNGLISQKAAGTDRTEKEVKTLNKKLSASRSKEVNSANPMGAQQWNDPEAEEADQAKVLANNAIPVPGADASITAREAAQKNPPVPTRNLPDDNGASLQRHTGTIKRITVYTDPLCCWSWGAQPHLDAVRKAMGEQATWTFRMGGLLPSWDRFHDADNAVTRPAQMGPVWMHAAQLTGRPIHYQIWITDPPSSSYPACIAVKCAVLQSEKLGERYLRAVQAACMAEGKNISRWPVLQEIADQLAKESPEDFNVERFVADYQGEAGKEAFRQDLQLVQFYQITRFPALIIEQKDRPAMLVTGYRTSSALLNILQTRNDATTIADPGS